MGENTTQLDKILWQLCIIHYPGEQTAGAAVGEGVGVGGGGGQGELGGGGGGLVERQFFRTGLAEEGRGLAIQIPRKGEV